VKRLLVLLAACSSKSEPPPVVLDLTCPAVVEHVAKLTLRASDYARPLVETPIAETDPRAFRQRRIDDAIKKACKADDACARKVVLDAMATDCVEREWSDDRKKCLLDAKDAAAIDACGPAPAPVLPAAPPTTPTKSLGEDCIADADCPAGAKCVAWTTEGGERNATCEIPCGPKQECPKGRGCVEQGGGPSNVCLENK
jgi:hypothetical protein